MELFCVLSEQKPKFPQWPARPNVICPFIFPLPLCLFPSAPPPHWCCSRPARLPCCSRNTASSGPSHWFFPLSGTAKLLQPRSSLCSDILFSKRSALPTLFETAVPSISTPSTPNPPYLALFFYLQHLSPSNILSSLLVVLCLPCYDTHFWRQEYFCSLYWWHSSS